MTATAVGAYWLAGGLGLATACEFVVALEAATVGIPAVTVGLFPVRAKIMRAADDVEAERRALIDGLPDNSHASIELGKTASCTQRDRDFDTALEYRHEVITILATSDASADGIAAYLNDTDPDWQHR